VSAISKSLDKSRKWLHTWINRYNNRKDEDWYKDFSKAPIKTNKKIDDEIEQQILLIRQELMNEKMSQIGAISIQYEFEKRGIKPLPHIWTINRVINKHNLINKPLVHRHSKVYPELFLHVHQMDLVGPRYIKGDGSFYSVNIIDVTNRTCHVKAVRSKASAGIVEALAAFWKTHGLPDALQMDNELAFRGSNRYPRSFGAVIRFALNQGVAVIFIPIGEPWRNGIIEKFNHNYQRHFLKAQVFENLAELNLREQNFIDFHNQNHRYSSQNNKTPNEAKALQLPAIFYTASIHLPNIKSEVNIPLTKGDIYYIRYIRSDLKLNLPNETFIVNECLKYSYVVAQISIDKHMLFVWQNHQLIQKISYPIPAVNW
jgi:hypothetical protein